MLRNEWELANINQGSGLAHCSACRGFVLLKLAPGCMPCARMGQACLTRQDLSVPVTPEHGIISQPTLTAVFVNLPDDHLRVGHEIHKRLG